MTTICLDAETIADLPSFSDEDLLTIHDMANRREQPIEQFVATAPPLARVVCVGMQNVETGVLIAVA